MCLQPLCVSYTLIGKTLYNIFSHTAQQLDDLFMGSFNLGDCTPFSSGQEILAIKCLIKTAKEIKRFPPEHSLSNFPLISPHV